MAPGFGGRRGGRKGRPGPRPTDADREPDGTDAPELTAPGIITAIEPQSNDPDRVSVYVDGEFRLGLPAEVAYAAHLRAGDAVTAERLAELARKDAAWRAREAALALLSFRPRSRAELRRRLVEKGFEGDVADECVAGLGEMGLVDDTAFAEMFVRDRVRLRPHGSRRLTQELRAKGVDAETAKAAIGEVLETEEASETELARRAAARWKPRPGEDRNAARRRLHGFLARRGFGGDAVRAVMDEILSGAGDDETDEE